jgi:hypothetical protein
MAEQYTHFKAVTAEAFILIKATIIIAAVVVVVAAIEPSAVSILQQLVMRPFCCLIHHSNSILFYLAFWRLVERTLSAISRSATRLHS